MSIEDHDHDSITLMQQQANQSIIHDLFAKGFINQQARDSVLALLYPHVSWGAWTSRMLQILGTLFIVTGLIFYFAFNFANMSSSYKLHTIEAALIACAAGAWAFSLSKLSGQLFLTFACILVGVFLAVFGQAYQTGADSYQLFLTWSLLILPWVCISQFLALWYLWLIILNISVSLYWVQSTTVNLDAIYFISFLQLLLFGMFLVLREYAQNKNISWCQQRLYRILLVLSILIISLVPIFALIQTLQWKNLYLSLSAILGLLIQFALIYYYRYKKIDIGAVGLTILALCLGGSMVSYKILSNVTLFTEPTINERASWLLMALMTLIIFTIGASILKKITPIEHLTQDKLL
ncbi:MAG: DUF2157 domain-containing protein [Proteobacteria bacterium]|nr:DUF2157 domain-containing protein [Pseudomonadota bacterium]